MQQVSGLYHRFMNILGLKIIPPSPDALSELTKAHLSAIPFENISKLYYKAKLSQNQLPTFDQYLSGIEDFQFGGTCYSNNYYFFKLLGFLGYQVKLCGADMKNPGSHMVIMITLQKKDYLVDVGYAAPFIQAIPLYLKKDFKIVSGRNQYLIKPRDEKGCSKLLMFQNGFHKHGYTIRPEARSLEDFQQVIFNSFQAEANFLNKILITKYIAGRFCTLHNLEYTETTREEISHQQFLERNELAKKVEDIFKIPANISSKILDEMELSGDAWS